MVYRGQGERGDGAKRTICFPPRSICFPSPPCRRDAFLYVSAAASPAIRRPTGRCARCSCKRRKASVNTRSQNAPLLCHAFPFVFVFVPRTVYIPVRYAVCIHSHNLVDTIPRLVLLFSGSEGKARRKGGRREAQPHLPHDARREGGSGTPGQPVLQGRGSTRRLFAGKRKTQDTKKHVDPELYQYFVSCSLSSPPPRKN